MSDATWESATLPENQQRCLGITHAACLADTQEINQKPIHPLTPA